MNRTLNEKKLTELLNYSETTICDFKEQNYNIKDDKSKVSFLKDILAMANTIRDSSAYIIIGVRQKDGHNEFIDVDTSIDENIFSTFIKGNVGPELPEFAYYNMKYKKHIVGVFEIGISSLGPFVSKKSYGDKVKKDEVYYRYGSTNTLATDIKKGEIVNWMKNNKSDNFKLISNKLELDNSDKYNYILFIGDEDRLSEQHYEVIANINWALIVDFIRNTEERGLYKRFHNNSINRHIIDKDTKVPQFYENKSLFWCLTPVYTKPGTDKKDIRKWNSEYLECVQSSMKKVISAITKPFIIVSLFVGECKNITDTLFGTVAKSKLFYKQVEISCNDKFEIDESDPQYTEIKCSAVDVCEAFANRSQFDLDLEDYYIVDNEQIKISNHLWIHEEMQPVYMNIEKKKENNFDDNISYFQGREIRWKELNPCIAVQRGKYIDLIQKLSNKFNSLDNKPNLVTIDYNAGAGVTTIMKMLAWFFHYSYPVVILNDYSKDGTIARLRSLSNDVKKKRILIVVDKHDYDIQVMSELLNSLEVDGIPATILFSRRHIRIDGRVDNYLDDKLEQDEKGNFERVYCEQIDLLKISEEEKRRRKETVYSIKKWDNYAITPFIYALCAFENDFIKLNDYVKLHLEDLNNTQKRILTIISAIHYYTGMEVPNVMIDYILKEEGIKNLKVALTPKQNRLLITSCGHIRTLHHVVSKELLKQISSHEMDNRNAWKSKLKDEFILIIDILEKFRDNNEAKSILKVLFLNQKPSNSNRSLGDSNDETHFSYALEDLDNIGKKYILQKLCEKFEYNPYTYSNLARYYYYIEENEMEALNYIQKALNIQEDYTFYHIKGIILAKKMINYIEKNVGEIKKDNKAFVDKLNNSFEEIEYAYDKSIELNIQNIAALTSKLNYILTVIRCVNNKICHDGIKVSDMLSMEKYSWCNEYISKANETLEYIRKIDLYMGTDNKDKIESYDSQILALQGNISEAISIGNNLLKKSDVYYPPIRNNLIKNYYMQCNKNWTLLENSNYEYIKKLIKDNIDEEPENFIHIVQWFDYIRNFNDDLNQTVQYFNQYVNNPDLSYYYRKMLAFFAYGFEYADKIYIKEGINCSSKCEDKAREKPNRNILVDIYNPNNKKMKRIESFKKYSVRAKDFNDALSCIPKIKGYIEKIEKPELGWIRIKEFDDIRVKFNPSYCNPSYYNNRIYLQTKDEGARVEFVLGFRLEGLYAYAVSDMK